MAQAHQFISKIDDISKLRIHPFPVKPVKMDRVVRHGIRGVVVGVSALGNIYSSQVPHMTYWLSTKRQSATVQSLIKLGLLSKAAIAQHNAAEAQEEKAQNRRNAGKDLIEASKVLGVPLSIAQRRIVRKLASDLN